MIDQVEHLEDALASSNFADPQYGYSALIDVPNFIDFILIQEFAKNVDGFSRSGWFRNIDSKFKMGPVWDFDAAFGNLITYNMWSTSGWLLDFGQGTWYSSGGLERFPAAFWFRRLLDDPAFANALKARYRDLRKPGGLWDRSHIVSAIDSLRTEIGAAELRSERRWRLTYFNPLHSVIFHAPPFDRTYTGNVEQFSTWINKRLEWLDQNIDSIEHRSGPFWK